MLSSPRLPIRTYSGKLADRSRWWAFKPRVGDIVVSTPPKSGTTWTQGILALVISGDPLVDADVARKSPWLDISVPDGDALLQGLEAQQHRRHIKTHTPLDGIPIWKELKYISVYRHPIDVHFSFRKHVVNMKEDVLRECFPDSISEGFRIFLEGEHQDGASLSSIVDHYKSAIKLETNTNLLLLHYADMLEDLSGAFQKIAMHVGIQHSEAVEKSLIQAATFSNMKANADRFAVSAKQGFWKEDTSFFDSATSNKWHGQLAQADLAAYDDRMSELLSVDERRWLEWGTAA
ncbi:sulfotransferase domain-containing protein [Cochlodiniinecator piscidefendens]|uniref:sulfotransferase domain-containing protein n=1 Tax=Cochlodiniinecator piscidefendens TaxID=2715756 RepID=UPI00140D2DE4|nr:sulfotransferase domain-containing protein [Cochlodiniinecator piscidefendens]